ncbi:MAG: type II toxin-antitoxin system RelE/ParE family toxin [Gammaproteobacteria bacterium]|nr:type II toxin-antitoxin system RelE/ParE family toxin [Gammaproteobacteria bacterium]
MRIEWSQRARTDIRDLKAYIAKDSPYYAKRFVERIIVSVEKLAEFPKIGRTTPEAEGRDDVRELIYQGYRLIYLVQPERVFIVTIIHGSRDLVAKENKPWDVV